MQLSLISCLIIALLLAITLVEARRAHGVHPKGPPMFVFGSSYVDTGNVSPTDNTRPYPWSKPYGETWPGKPAGRYGNGHVLTDVIAQALNLSVPTTFAKRRVGAYGPIKESNGVNFAIGGSGVLPTMGFSPISSQIDAFQSLAATYSAQELASALVIYSTAGDDYFYYSSSLSGIYPLTVSVGKQISVDLVKLYGMGLRKFMVTYLPPTGCLPIVCGENLYKTCNDTWTTNVAQQHNARVFKNVIGLRHYFKNGTILLLDLYSVFTSAQSTIGLGTLRPCCVGSTASTKCGSLDAGGGLAYNLCSKPNLQFYWDDMIHPTEVGWKKVVEQLKPTLAKIVK